MDNSALEYMDMYYKIVAIFDEYGIDANTYLIDPTPNTAMAHAKILEVIAGSIKDAGSKLGLIMNNRNRIASIYNKHSNTEDIHTLREFGINKVIKIYLLDMYGHFYTVKDGKVVFTHSEDFDLPTKGRNADIKRNYEYIHRKIEHMKDDDKELALILTHDGKMYHAPYDHQTLAYWLNLNGISLKNAIRVEATKRLGDFSFTSLHNYRFSLDSDSDKLVSMSYEQAENLGALYSTICSSWRYMKPIDKTLKNSTGFGIGKTEEYDEYISSGNMKKLSMYMPELNVQDYIRELKSKSSVHDTMSHSYNLV